MTKYKKITITVSTDEDRNKIRDVLSDLEKTIPNIIRSPSAKVMPLIDKVLTSITNTDILPVFNNHIENVYNAIINDEFEIKKSNLYCPTPDVRASHSGTEIHLCDVVFTLPIGTLNEFKRTGIIPPLKDDTVLHWVLHETLHRTSNAISDKAYGYDECIFKAGKGYDTVGIADCITIAFRGIHDHLDVDKVEL